jgi:hypothetical protein
MTLKRKAAVALLALIVCFFMLMVSSRERYDQRPRTATFLGFTNTGPHELHAILRFPSVHPRAPASTFFYKPVYNIIIDVGYVDSAGRGRTRRIGDRIHVSPKSPVGDADVLVPVPPDSVSLTFLKAKGVLGSYGDNELFGWRPPGPKEYEWKFEIDQTPIVLTNPAATSAF